MQYILWYSVLPNYKMGILFVVVFRLDCNNVVIMLQSRDAGITCLFRHFAITHCTIIILNPFLVEWFLDFFGVSEEESGRYQDLKMIAISHTIDSQTLRYRFKGTLIVFVVYLKQQISQFSKIGKTLNSSPKSSFKVHKNMTSSPNTQKNRQSTHPIFYFYAYTASQTK